MIAGVATALTTKTEVPTPDRRKDGRGGRKKYADLTPLLTTSVSGYRPGGKCICDAEPGAWPYELIWGVPGYPKQRAGSASLELLEFAAECLAKCLGATVALGLVNNRTGSVRIPGIGAKSKWQKL